MIDRRYSVKSTVHGVRIVMLLGLLLATWPGASTGATVQSNGGMVIGATLSCGPTACGPEFSVQVSVTTDDGESLGSCTVTGNVLDQSHVPGCAVDFPSQPTGTLIVTEDVSTLPAGYGPVENPMYVDSTQLGSASHDVIFQNVLQTVNAGTAQTSDVAIATTENGGAATDVCYVLVDFSNEGCDRNGDGQVAFEDVPVGAYTVRQTADLGSGRSVDDFTIQVTGALGSGGREVFSTTVDAASGGSEVQPSPDGAVDIALITREPEDGDLLTGACYVLVGYSNEGCDENGDGQVTFAQVLYDTYTVQQTRTPAGYPTINDYEISIQPVDGIPGLGTVGYPLGFIVKQAPEQNLPDTRNVSVHLLDMIGGSPAKLMDGICVELVGASEIDCDRDLVDGQIDFLDVPVGGPYEIRFSNTPTGFVSDFFDSGPIFVSIVAGTGVPSNAMIFVLVGVDSEFGGSNGDREIAPQEVSQRSGTATVVVTFRGCPESFVPDVEDPYAACTIPLDAPDASLVGEFGVGQSLVPITGLERQYDGSYIFYASSDGGFYLELTGLEPVLRDDFLIYGVDDQDGSSYITLLDNGETREIVVFYYYEEE